MALKISTSNQQSWYIIEGILKNYILHTATPLIFKNLLKDYSKFDNEGSRTIFKETKQEWEAEQATRAAGRDAVAKDCPEQAASVEKEKAFVVAGKYSPSKERGHGAYRRGQAGGGGYRHGGNGKTPKFYAPTLLQDVWEILFKEGMVMVFIQRLLGSQQDMETYRMRSDKYVQLLEEIIGTNNQYNEMETLTKHFMNMMKDYLCRNVPELKGADESMSIADVLETTRKAYQDRLYMDNSEAYVERLFFVRFNELSYSKALLQQMDEIATSQTLPTKCRHFLVAAEYIHTLFIYVYMVEFIKKYPFKKSDTNKVWTNELSMGSRYNLFAYLKHVDYITAYRKEKKRKEEKNQE